MKPILFFFCNLIVLAYGIYAASAHGAAWSWLIVTLSIVIGLALSGQMSGSLRQPHRISWRRTFLHGRIRPVGHRHSSFGQ